jgi:MinD-like ATPase involved in chromosome partitioning or flagellar assembly
MARIIGITNRKCKHFRPHKVLASNRFAVFASGQKGGVGKTTTALALGVALSIGGKRVLYVDLDPQCNLSQTLKVNPDVGTAFDVLSGRMKISTAIQRTDSGRLRGNFVSCLHHRN